jgi:hypothetical protein
MMCLVVSANHEQLQHKTEGLTNWHVVLHRGQVDRYGKARPYYKDPATELSVVVADEHEMAECFVE